MTRIYKRFRVQALAIPAKHPEFEEELIAWIRKHRARGRCVNSFFIQFKATKLFNQYNPTHHLSADDDDSYSDTEF